MSILLDVQSEFSLPEGGAAVDALVRRAAALGIRGLALADRGTLAAAPAFVRAARAAGIEPRVGVRCRMQGTPGLDVLIFPRDARAWPVLAELARRGEVGAQELATIGGEAVSERLRVLAVLHRAADHGSDAEIPAPGAARISDRDAVSRFATALHALRSAVGSSGLALALPDLRDSTLLVELGRDLALPCVLAPPVHIVEVEDALLHRLLVMIRGDHESGGSTPRPGRPAFEPGALVTATSILGRELAPDAERFFAELAVPDEFVEPPLPDLVPDAEAMAALRHRVLARCAAQRRLPPESVLTAELEAIARRGALVPLAKLTETLRALGDRVHLGVDPGWCESWVGWALGLTTAPPRVAVAPPDWVDGHGPLPPVTIEMGEAGARALLTLLEIAGAQEPRVAIRLGPGDAVRWLATERGYDSSSLRRITAMVAGRSQARERAPAGSRRLIAVAAQLAGRIIDLAGDATMRVWSPLWMPGREIDRLTADATATGGLAVAVRSTPTLSLLERAGVSGRRLAAGGADPVPWSELADLMAGPLAGRGGAAFAHLLRQRQPATVLDLARSLALARRAPDAPAPHVPQMTGREARASGARPEILFHSDASSALRRAGVGEETAGELLRRAAEGRGGPMAAMRPNLVRDLEAAGGSGEQAEAILGALVRIVPHLESEGPWLARAQALSLLADLAARSPEVLAPALADLLPDRMPSITAWAKPLQIGFLRPDLNSSAVDSRASGAHGETRLVRLGLLHLPGVDRATAEVLAGLRAEAPFSDREDVVRRLRHRIPEQRLRALLGNAARGEMIAGQGAGARPSMAPRAQRERVSTRRSIRPSNRGHATVEPLGDAMQFELFSGPAERQRIYTPALARHGILRLDRVVATAEGSRVRTVGVIRSLSGLVTRAGRRLARGRLEDGGGAIDLLLLPTLFDTAEDVPLGRPVVVAGRVSVREGRIELVVESAIPLELLAQVEQPPLEILLPHGFRRLRALKLRLLKSPGRSPVHVRARSGERAQVAALGLGRLGVTVDDGLLEDLRVLVGSESVRLVGPAGERAAPMTETDLRAAAGAA